MIKTNFQVIVQKFQTWAEMVKLEHTVFSAPFMLVAMFLASSSQWPKPMVLFWCAVALLGARSAAMTLNRLIDARIDGLNPRTASRAIPAGKFSSTNAIWLSVLGFALLAIASLNLPRACLYLMPIAVVWLTFYSFVKRFSWLCHFVLGVALGGAVLGGWLAVAGSLSLLPVLLALGVVFWVAGFDIIYALQDQDFDRANALHSIPAKFGLVKSLVISRICHVVSFVFFLLTGLALNSSLGLGFGLEPSGALLIGYGLGVGVLAWGLISQHLVVSKDLQKVNEVFFVANAWISSLFFLSIFLAKIIFIHFK